MGIWRLSCRPLLDWRLYKTLGSGGLEADIGIFNGAERVAMEIRIVRSVAYSRGALERAVLTASRLISAQIVNGVVVFIYNEAEREYLLVNDLASGFGNKLQVVIGTESAGRIRR